MYSQSVVHRAHPNANDISKWDWNECVGRVIAKCAVDGTFRAWLIELLLCTHIESSSPFYSLSPVDNAME